MHLTLSKLFQGLKVSPVSGIGIDDMFVIVQCLDNIELREDSKEVKLREKIALTMKQAGVAITLTSVTDIMCFFSAAITILPVLQVFWEAIQ